MFSVTADLLILVNSIKVQSENLKVLYLDIPLSHLNITVRSWSYELSRCIANHSMITPPR